VIMAVPMLTPATADSGVGAVSRLERRRRRSVHPGHRRGGADDAPAQREGRLALVRDGCSGDGVAVQRPAARPATVPELHAHWKLNAGTGGA